jgi:hypothetical protein
MSVAYNDIEAAQPTCRNRKATPIMTSTTLDQMIGVRVLIKAGEHVICCPCAKFMMDKRSHPAYLFVLR